MLQSAGIEDTDILIAVTAQDEINLVACQVAHRCFNVPQRIARVRSPQWTQNPQLLSTEGFAVDVAISPEATITDYLTRLIEIPEALQVLDFANGRVGLLAVRADAKAHWPIVPSKSFVSTCPMSTVGWSRSFVRAKPFCLAVIPVLSPMMKSFCRCGRTYSSGDARTASA